MKKTIFLLLGLVTFHVLTAQTPVHFTTCAKFWSNNAPIPYYTPVIAAGGAAISITYPQNGYQQGCLPVTASMIPDDPGTQVKTYLDRNDTSSCLNGVTIADMVAIRRHILGIATLSPFGMIAADVNRSGSITTFDMVIISKYLLGLQSEFQNVSDWRFFPAEWMISDPTNPFTNPFITPQPWPEHPFGALEGDTLRFVGLRTGDVDGDADPSLPCSFRPIQDSVDFSLPSVVLPENVTLRLPVMVSGNFSIAGFQMEFALDPSIQFNKIVSGTQPIQTNQYTVQNGKVRVVVLNDIGMSVPTLQPNVPLFYIELTATKPILTKDAIQLYHTGALQAQIIQGQSGIEHSYAFKPEYNILLNYILGAKDATADLLAVDVVVNPFVAAAEIQVNLPEAETLNLEVFDAGGRLTHRQQQQWPAGKQILQVPESALTPGSVGFYRITTGSGKMATGKLVRQ